MSSTTGRCPARSWEFPQAHIRHPSPRCSAALRTQRPFRPWAQSGSGREGRPWALHSHLGLGIHGKGDWCSNGAICSQWEAVCRAGRWSTTILAFFYVFLYITFTLVETHISQWRHFILQSKIEESSTDTFSPSSTLSAQSNAACFSGLEYTILLSPYHLVWFCFLTEHS